MEKERHDKMKIENNIIKHYLRNVYFIVGTAYAGKSTMVKMLAEKYNMICCGENYHMSISKEVAVPSIQPNLCYFDTMKDWQEFISRTPEEYTAWIKESGREAAEFEVAELIRISQNQKVIVDTNIPLELLYEIADYHQVAVMLSPQSMSVEYFFEREDEEKKFILEQIHKAPNPQKAMENYKNCLAMINSRENYERYVKSGFFTLIRNNANLDTKEAVLNQLVKHFGLEDNIEEVKVLNIKPRSKYWNALKEYASDCSWIAGKHIADMLEKNTFQEWESVFVAVMNEKIIGYCTLLETDYYPENRYFPWISSIFVGEPFRGRRISELLINEAAEYAKCIGFQTVYIPSDIIGLYEKYGFKKIDVLTNYGGDIDNIFTKIIC